MVYVKHSKYSFQTVQKLCPLINHSSEPSYFRYSTEYQHSVSSGYFPKLTEKSLIKILMALSSEWMSRPNNGRDLKLYEKAFASVAYPCPWPVLTRFALLKRSFTFAELLLTHSPRYIVMPRKFTIIARSRILGFSSSWRVREGTP